MPGTPVRYPNGLTNAAPNSPLANYPLPVPFSVHAYENDWDLYTAAQWTITSTGASTIGLIDADGGILSVVTNTTIGNGSYFQKIGESFLLKAGKRAWFSTRISISVVTTATAVFGLQITDTTPADATDGVWFSTTTGSANLDFNVIKNSVNAGATAITTLTNATYAELAWTFDGVNEFAYFVNGVKLGSVQAASWPDDEELTVSFGMVTGAAAARTLLLDWTFAACER